MQLPPVKDVKRIGIIGTGTIGASWAAHFLGQGMQVSAWDPASDGEKQTREYIERVWPAVQALGAKSGAGIDNLHWCKSAADVVADAQFIQESVPERLSLKIDLYKGLDDVLPADAILSTSTSGLLLSELQAGRRGAERYVLGHPFNPPHLIPLVEVVGGKDTDPAVVDWTLDFYNGHGKMAIRLNREVPGHLANRMQAAIWREAVDAVVSGLASVEDVDRAIAYGPGLRWALMGPHQIFALAGGDGGMRDFMEHFGPANESWWASMNNDVRLTQSVKDQIIAGVEQEQAGQSPREISQQRDQLLVDLLKTLKDSRQRLNKK